MSLLTSQPNSPPSRILIVDDDPLICLVARRTLTAAGFEVVDAGGGQAGITAFEREAPDLILLDVEMPDLDGFEVCKRIRATEAGRYIPILILTGREDVESIEKAYRVGATDFTSKPLNWTILGNRIPYILRASDSFLAVRDQQNRMDEIQDYARLGSWEIDIKTGLLSASSTLRSMFDLGDPSEHREAEKFIESDHTDDQDSLRSLVSDAIREQTGFSLEHRTLDAFGTERIMHTRARFRESPGGNGPTIEGFSQDITERKRTEERVDFLAYSDQLTGLANRAGFKRQLDGALQRGKRTGNSIAILSVDLDQFMRVNDTFGHSGGDLLIQSVADQLSGCIRETDAFAGRGGRQIETVISRPGGDEFTILLENLTEPGDAGRVAHRALKACELPILVEGHEIRITSSIGIAVWPDDGQDSETLLRNADSAMYHAKELGRANFQFYRDDLNAHALERLELETSLRRAIENEDLVVYYQPKLALESGRITGCEALVRWPGAPAYVVSPEDFIPVAEAYGLIHALGEQVLRQACRSARAWQQRGHPDFKLAVNLSPSQLKDDQLVERIEAILDETGFDPSDLELEITESALIDNEEPAREVLEKLRRRDIRISLDDFGTGFSSLSYLKRFPVQSIKIDKSFVGGIGSNDDDEAITTAILSMARDLGLRVVAEGIETEAQLQFLRERHCDDVQGYLISPPIAADEFERFLETYGA